MRRRFFSSCERGKEKIKIERVGDVLRCSEGEFVRLEKTDLKKNFEDLIQIWFDALFYIQIESNSKNQTRYIRTQIAESSSNRIRIDLDQPNSV